MDIIKAAESLLKARLDEYAFEINSCLQNSSNDGALDRFLSLMNKYSSVSGQLDTLTLIRRQLRDTQETEETEESEKDEG